MVIKCRMKWFWAGLLLSGLITLPCLGQTDPGAAQAADPKAVEAAGKITPALEAILTQANESKVPAQKEISSGQTLIDSSKRYFPKMDDKQKAQYCLLQSWVAYYSGQTETAHANAVKAWSLDKTSSDVLVTQVAMALVAGKKPMLPRPQKPAKPQRNRQAGGGMEGFEMGGNPQDSMSQIQPGKLSFDITQFLAEAIDKKLEPMELDCLNGTTFSYKPGEEAVCVLFWQKYETEKAAVSNEPNRGGAVMQQPAMPPMMEMGGMYEGGMMGAGEEVTPTRAFRRLFRSGFAGDTRVKFLAVNLDSAGHKEDVVDEMIRQPQAWAQVLAADQTVKSFPESGGITPDKPVLMMADSTGTVRYAGPARGFIAPMLLNTFLGKSLTLPVESQAVVADSNSVSSPAPAVQTPALQPEQNAVRPQAQVRELSEEDKIMAERKLGATRDLFMQLGKKAGLNYARGVKFCREIIKDYPGSEYADEARKLMREIPENERARYNITDEELGL